MSQQSDSLPQLVAKFINNTNQNIFLTGKAGTGKTTFLRNITKHTHKSVVVAAPTGIAAINAGGVTLHSLFQLPFGAFIPDNNGLNNQSINTQINTPRTLLSSFQMHKTKRNMLQKMELLIIDEVSMLRADLLDAIDLILRSVRRDRDTPFGGVQVLFIGDLLQLPPVVKDEEWRMIGQYYPSAFFFSSQVLRQAPPLYVELEKIYRQSDNAFIGVLNNLRNNVMTSKDADLLNNYYKPGYEQKSDEGVILLTTHNRIANDKNLKALNNLKTPSVYFKADVIGDFKEYSYPTEERLEFKMGAQVMFTKNDYSGEQKYFNGKIGTITKLNRDKIEVSFSDGSASATAEPYLWENKKFSVDKDSNEIEESIVGTFKQYPLKLAWAITVHKSQGLTFDKAIIDVQNAFAPGQIYVALSRLRSLGGLILTSPIPTEGFQVDPALKSFSELKQQPESLNPVLQSESQKYFKGFVMKAFDFAGLMQDLSYHISSYNKDAKKSVKQQHKSRALAWMKETEPIRSVADSFRAEVYRIVGSGNQNYLRHLLDRINKAAVYFEPLIKTIHDDIRALSNELKGTKGAKAYHTELIDLSNLYYGQLQLVFKAQTLIKTSLEGTDFDKNSIRKPEFAESRENLAPVKKKTLKEKKEKEDTKLLTFQMYKDGKNIKAIAKDRSLTEGTVEGHIAHYVQLGEVDVLDFIGQGKLAMIEKAIHKLDSFALTPLKKELGKEFSYGELRLGAAYVIAQNLKE